MRRKSVNPFSWHEADDQGVVIEAPTRFAFVSGQTAMSDGGEPQHPGDMRRQVELTLDNLESVLHEAGMTFADIVQMNTHVTDVDQFMSEAADYMGKRLAAFDVSPPGVLSGTTRLGLPELVVEIDAIAADSRPFDRSPSAL